MDFILRFNSVGNFYWANNYGSMKPGEQFGPVIAANPDGSVYLYSSFSDTANYGGGNFVSYGSLDFQLSKYDSSGTSLWSEQFGGTNQEIAKGIYLSNVGDLYLAGRNMSSFTVGNNTITAQGGGDIFLAKLEEQVLISIDKISYSIIQINPYPNPFNTSTFIELPPGSYKNLSVEIYSMTGKQIRKIEGVSSGNIEIARNNLGSGLYLFKIIDNKAILARGKLIVE